MHRQNGPESFDAFFSVNDVLTPHSSWIMDKKHWTNLDQIGLTLSLYMWATSVNPCSVVAGPSLFWSWNEFETFTNLLDKTKKSLVFETNEK